MKSKTSFATLSTLVLYLAFGQIVWAQATRTWVSGVGDDANPCSRTAPCKTFAGAISKTAAGGEIDALDPAGYGAVTITKAITIDGTGTIASILASGVNGIYVAAGVSDTVVIRGISINGAGTGVNGIRFTSGGTLHIEDCTLSGFTGQGVDFEPNGVSQLFIKNTSIKKAVSGVLVKAAITGYAAATIENCFLTRLTVGLRTEDRSVVFVKNTTASGNTNNGFLASSTIDSAEMNLESCMSTGNGTNGINAAGPYSIIRLSNVTVIGNTAGLTTSGGGQTISFLNNKIAGNSVNGSPTIGLTMQ